MGSGRRDLVVGTVLLAIGYYAGARLGLQLQFEATQATPVWPPSGLGFAVLLLAGPRLAGGVLLGAVLANLTDFYVKSALAPGTGLLAYLAGHPEHVVASVAIGIGNLLEVLAGSWLVRRLAPLPDIAHTVRSAFLFLVVSLACCVIASTIGVATLRAIGVLPPALTSTTWFTWWLGDAAGIWIIAPLVIAWASGGVGVIRALPWARIAAMLLPLVLFAELTFGGWLEALLAGTSLASLVPVLLRTAAYLLIPLLLWVAFRFGAVAGTLGVTVTSALAVLGTIAGHGPFVDSSQNAALLGLQAFIGITSIAVLLLDAALRERQRAFAALAQARDGLERRVEERTAALRDANAALQVEVEARRAALEQLERETAERRRAEEILHQSQKMEAIGQLTGGIAHDFNNLLTVILGSLGLADRQAAGNERLKRLLNAARTAADRGAGLTQDLLAFSRRQPLRTQIVLPSERLISACNLLRRSLRDDIELVVHLPKDVRAIEVDAMQLELTLLNIGLNARDAMPDGGTLRVEAGNIQLDERTSALAAGLVGDFVAITISDTGTGIPPELTAKVFEPFFTTKEVGKGSGLGLSQAYGFARQSGGTIALDSTPGLGTAVTLYLPVATTAADSLPQPTPVLPPDTETPAGMVLVVEDDPDVADLAAQLIGDLGYGVRVAGNGRSALDLLRDGDPIDLVFSDIMMPGGVNGIELGRAVRARFPQVAVLLATGFSEAAIGAEAKGFTLITKPYRADELARALAGSLRDHRHARDRPALAAAGPA